MFYKLPICTAGLSCFSEGNCFFEIVVNTTIVHVIHVIIKYAVRITYDPPTEYVKQNTKSVKQIAMKNFLLFRIVPLT